MALAAISSAPGIMIATTAAVSMKTAKARQLRQQATKLKKTDFSGGTSSHAVRSGANQKAAMTGRATTIRRAMAPTISSSSMDLPDPISDTGPPSMIVLAARMTMEPSRCRPPSRTNGTRCCGMP